MEATRHCLSIASSTAKQQWGARHSQVAALRPRCFSATGPSSASAHSGTKFVAAGSSATFFDRQQQADYDPARWGFGAQAYDCALGAKYESYAYAAMDLIAARLGDNNGQPFRLIDVGCGTGAVAAAFCAHPLLRAAKFQCGQRHSMLNTDFSDEMLGACTRKVDALRASPSGATVDWRCELQDGHALREPDSSYDAATAMFSLLFFSNRQSGLQELVRVLRPGGCAVVGAWGPAAQLEWVRFGNRALKEVLGPRLSVLGRPPLGAAPANFLALSDAGLFSVEMHSAGFKQVEIVPVSRRFAVPDADAAVELWHGMAASYPTIGYALDELCSADGGSTLQRPELEREVAAAFAHLILSRGPGSEGGMTGGFVEGTALLGVGST